MTRTEIKSLVGRKTNIMNSSGTIVDGLVTDDDLNEFVDVRYKEMYSFLADKYPENYEVTTQFPSVADRSLYAFSGDSDDLYTIRYVGVKYDSADTYFTRATPRPYSILHKYSTDKSFFNAGTPKYAQTSLKETSSGLLYQAIYLVPAPTAVIANSIMVKYLEIPSLSADSDELLAIPSVAQHLVSYAVVSDVWEKKGDWAKAERAFNRFLLARQEFVESYKPRASDSPARMVPNLIFDTTGPRWQ